MRIFASTYALVQWINQHHIILLKNNNNNCVFADFIAENDFDNSWKYFLAKYLYLK